MTNYDEDEIMNGGSNCSQHSMSGGSNCNQHSMNGGNKLDTGFLEYMTTFTMNERQQVLNLLQYGGLAILPLLIVLKVLKMYMPEDDLFKSSPELILEVLIQISFILVMFFFIHKMVIYIPTYSKLDYDNFSILSAILPLLFIMFALDTRLSEKCNTLFNRLLGFIGVQESYEDMKPTNTSKEVKNKGTKTSINNNVQQPNLLIPGQGIHDSRIMGGGKEQTRDLPVNNETFMSQEPFEPMAANDLGIGSSFFN